MTRNDQDVCGAVSPAVLPSPMPSPSAALDRVTRLAALAFAAPMAAVSMMDETCQWHVSRVGALPPMVPRAGAPCFTVSSSGRALAVADLRHHPDYFDGLLAQCGARFYAGAPLLAANGAAVGAISVMAPSVREASAAEMTALADLAALAMLDVELREAGGRVHPLSGLPNRQQLIDELGALADREPDRPRLLAVIDLARPDELSRMLRAVGSAYVDAMVRQDAQALHARLGRTTRLYHVAATQFALIAPPGAEPVSFAATLQQLGGSEQRALQAAFSTTCTTGLARVVPGEAAPSDLFRRAHAALDDARARRMPVGVYSPDQDAAFARAFTLLNDFPSALVDDVSLRLVFQPRLELATGRCVGVEALLRWTHPTLGEVSPGEFVRLIETTTLARDMMRWVLSHALRQLLAWRATGIELQLSVNVSPSNLEEPDFAAHVLGALSGAGLPAEVLELEITENALLGEDSPAMQQLRSLSDAGVGIAIDDFGTGYSSLSYLQRLPASVVKIDQSFVRGLTAEGVDEGRRRTLVTALIGLSHDLGYRVVAEGIETQAAADMLRRLDCDEVQGFHFARPMPPAAFQVWHSGRPWRPSVTAGRGAAARACVAAEGA